MDQIIRKVIETEYKAQRMIDEAELERKQMTETMEKSLMTLKNQVFLEMDLKLQAVKQQETGEAAVRSEEIMSEAKSRALAMQNIAAEKMDRWVSEILDRILFVEKS